MPKRSVRLQALANDRSPSQPSGSDSSGDDQLHHLHLRDHSCQTPDPSMTAATTIDSFFSSPHSISMLTVMLIWFLYVAMYVTASPDIIMNTKIGLGAMVAVFICLGVLLLPDGTFVRPHPLFWRLILSISAVYQLCLTFLLFQSVHDARHLLTFVDSSLGHPLPEKSYAGNCDLTYDNIVSQFDIFVIAHALGWVGKAIMFRDYWICWVLSIMFEILEYSLQHQLPNFAECWWDHWILDVLVCNWLGLEIGMKVCEYFEMKSYSWRGLRQIPSYAGKVRRAVAQFTPASWTKFEWQFTTDPRHFAMVTLLITTFLQGELNAFYLKYLLWIPPSHIFNTLRLLFFFISGSSGIREAYQYVNDPTCKRLGPQAWLNIANIMTETLVCFKFGKNEFKQPFPVPVVVFWSCLLVALVVFAVHRFLLYPHKLTARKKTEIKRE